MAAKNNLTVTKEESRKATMVADAIAKAIRIAADESFEIGFSHYRLAVRKIFETEGPGWTPLDPYTIRRREQEGFAPGPILQRTGSLARSLTDYKMGRQSGISTDRGISKASRDIPIWEMSQGQLNSMWDSEQSIVIGNELTTMSAGANRGWTFKILDERFQINQEGGTVGKKEIPARPMLPTGAAYDDMMRSMDLHLKSYLDQAILWKEMRRRFHRSAREGNGASDFIWRDRTIRTSDWSKALQWSEAPWF